ncbi:MAG: metal-dependent hydrolase [Alphaproteobacteria bacterium]
MDPITQGALGAALPQATATTRKGPVALAGLFGWLAGMAADLDVFIRSAEDPLLFLEYHRQFTHALLFIPVGGLICAAVLHFLLGRRMRLGFARTLLFCTLGYGTHGLLDFMTSYGTMLFWPFSDARHAANIVSIIDPLMTVPLVALVVLAAIRRSPVPARLALGWACLYLTLGAVQHSAAARMAEDLAAARGHVIERLTVKPSFGNLLVWRSVYESNGRFHVDGMRAGIAPMVFPGPSVARLDPARDFPWLDPASRQFRDLTRFDRFSQGYLARSPNAPETVIDVRFAFLPNSIGALWSIALTPDGGPERHARYQTNRRDARANLAALWRMITAGREG